MRLDIMKFTYIACVDNPDLNIALVNVQRFRNQF